MFRQTFHEQATKRAVVTLFINLILILLWFVSAVSLGIFLNNRQAIDQELHHRGRAIVESIILARNWNASYGGVYVRKDAGMKSNPFLVNPDMTTADGTVYTKKNPALMVREISEALAEQGSFQFRITSLKPLNPGNRPDDFEQGALRRFEQGDREVSVREQEEESTFFRFMVPLLVEASCLECHDPAYRPGDVRGGISVRFNIDAVETTLTRNMLAIGTLALISFVLLFALIYRLFRQFGQRLKATEEKLRQLAVTDELTGLKNRRYLMERLRGELKAIGRHRQPLVCILFDLDHFKRVNDTFGHDAGDRVLQGVADTIRHQCRENTILARIGGEEFMVLLPCTPLEGGRLTAERLRQAIAETPIPLPDGTSLPITASFGVACLVETAETEKDQTDLLKRVDEALYQAKDKGRNRVEVSA